MNKVILGSHVPFTKSNRYYLGAVETTILNNANALMVYTGPPQRSLRVDEKELEIPAAQLLAKKHHLDFNHFVVHAPYIINLASNQVATRKFSIDFLVKEIQRTHSLGIKKIVLHPGFALGHPTMDQAISTLVHSLQQVINQVQQLGVKICLETMAGKGSEIGFRLEQLGQIIAGCAFSPALGVCLDTCHLHDAGYDLGQKKTILSTIQRTFGLDRVEVLHINDSSYPLGARKDRHANIGYGHIGFDNLLQ